METEKGIKRWTWDEFCETITKLPEDQLWRHNQAGDLPGENERIDAVKLKKLVKANHGRRGFTFTHKPLTDRNKELIRYANNRGFTINLSASSLEEADDLLQENIGPVVTTLPSNWKPKTSRTPGGAKVIKCPHDFNPKIKCRDCALCYRGQERGFVIGFPAHGTGKSKVNERFSENSEVNR